jgi:hypothetical protein
MSNEKGCHFPLFSQNNLETYQKLSDFLEFIDNPNNKKNLYKNFGKTLGKTIF